ncbi:pirin family protein [Marinigracilibium pacificum]|uniref:Pirin family protein n=1 Tax=Marinigracilibium pacificum TaxID=2729599 RepID=A0A848J002_9BACT|nr:pirin family protein [Marinigracilibium pacificum]NMM48971.1 pirin family protein [Marinigracilibium pacificum]
MEKERSPEYRLTALKTRVGNHPVLQAFPQPGIDHANPFLLLHHLKINRSTGDYPLLFVPPHPHRGFCPVTLVFNGAVEHKDSLGNDVIIKEGGVQWITAGKGIIHSEKEALNEDNKKYRDFQIIQLWVNLKEKDKLSEPAYLPLNKSEIPSIPLENKESTIKLVSGNYKDIKGVEKRTEDINIFTINSVKGEHLCFDLPARHQVVIYQLEGISRIGNEFVESGNLMYYDPGKGKIKISVLESGILILLSAEQWDEKVVAHGPFVMNREIEIMEAIRDFETGQMGRM